MRDVGYRINVRPEWIVALIEKYGEYFRAMEVKATEEFMKDVVAQSFVDFCSKRGVSKLSFQLPAKAFIEEKDCALTCDFLSEMNNGTDVISVTYFLGASIQNEDYLHVISRTAKDNMLVVAIENMYVKRNLIGYLKDLKECAIRYNFKVCLDLGTLFYTAMKCKVSDDELISFFGNDAWWKEHVVQIYVHDYNYSSCFLSFGDGYLGKDFRPLKRIMGCFTDECPIIFKTTIQDIGTQGVIEVKEFFKTWEKTLDI